MFVLLPGEVARGLDRNNSPRERRFETGLVITSGTLLSSPFISSPLKSDSYVIQRKDVKSTSCLSRSLPLLSYIPKNRRWKQMEIAWFDSKDVEINS